MHHHQREVPSGQIDQRTAGDLEGLGSVVRMHNPVAPGPDDQRAGFHLGEQLAPVEGRRCLPLRFEGIGRLAIDLSQRWDPVERENAGQAPVPYAQDAPTSISMVAGVPTYHAPKGLKSDETAGHEFCPVQPPRRNVGPDIFAVPRNSRLLGSRATRSKVDKQFARSKPCSGISRVVARG